MAEELAAAGRTIAQGYQHLNNEVENLKVKPGRDQLETSNHRAAEKKSHREQHRQLEFCLYYDRYPTPQWQLGLGNWSTTLVWHRRNDGWCGMALGDPELTLRENAHETDIYYLTASGVITSTYNGRRVRFVTQWGGSGPIAGARGQNVNAEQGLLPHVNVGVVDHHCRAPVVPSRRTVGNRRELGRSHAFTEGSDPDFQLSATQI
jgi:hypothetical protein